MNEYDKLLSVRKEGIDPKIVAALERISQALKTLAWIKSKEILLNPIQIQLLIFLLHHGEMNNRINTLAREFNITNASISDTISSLEQKQLIIKAYNKDDPRNFVVKLTYEGQRTAKEATSYTDELLFAVKKLPASVKKKMFSVLGDIIFELHNSGIVPVQRMCLTCKHYNRSVQGHYCNLLDRKLIAEELKIDCKDHIPL